MSVPLVGFLGLGHFDADRDVFVEAEGYTRPKFAVPTDDIFTVSDWIDIAGPIGFWVTHGCVFAAETGAYPLAFWRWSSGPLMAPCRWPPLDVFMQLSGAVLHAVNATETVGGAAKVDVAKNAVIGSLNGRALHAGCRLVVSDGMFIPRSQQPKKASTTAC